MRPCVTPSRRCGPPQSPRRCPSRFARPVPCRRRKDELEAAKNTFACQSGGERIVIRFDVGEARLLMADGDRVSLYQIPAASGVRYSNGRMELRGKGTDLQLVLDGAAVPLTDCQPYRVPK